MLGRRKKEAPQSEFMRFVQLHERAWGDERYPGRPNLTEIMEAPIVIFWEVEGKTDRYSIALYEDIRTLEKFITRMLILGNVNLPRQRIGRAFLRQKRLRINGVKLVFSSEEE